MKFKTPLKTRLYIASYYRERYQNDPAYRLRKINDLRIRLGLEPRGSVEEIAPRRGRVA